jgi:hypothetical protein
MAGILDGLFSSAEKKKRKDTADGAKKEKSRREKVKGLGKAIAEPKSLFGKTQRAIEEREKRLKNI